MRRPRYLSTLGTSLKLAGLLVCAAALALGGFGAWGVWTVAGRRRFDEMDGLLPLAALAAAAAGTFAGPLLIWLGSRPRSRRRRR